MLDASQRAATDAERTAWRKQKRVELLALRSSLTEEARSRNTGAILGYLAPILRNNPPATVAAYYPFRGEINLLGLIEELLREGWVAALPAVVAKDQPLEFRSWRPNDPMSPGVFGIPFPATPLTVHPSIFLVPLVGFDDACFRLGYGGGYYDRTLAVATARRLTLGIGFEATRVPTIDPSPFDIPMDGIVTEAGVRWR